MQSEFELVEIEKVKAYHIKQFLAWMDDKGRQPRYINDLLKVFKTFFNYMVKDGHIVESPAAKVKNMKQPKTKIITFSENEIRKILNFYCGRTYLEIRNRTMLAMFFDTGMRLSEVITFYTLKVREIQKPEKKETYKGLTAKKMREFISWQYREDTETMKIKINEFDTLEKFYDDFHKTEKHSAMKAWFLKNHKEEYLDWEKAMEKKAA